MTPTNVKRFIMSAKDQRVTEVSEDLWNNLVSRSDMTWYRLNALTDVSEEIYSRLWVDSKVYDFSSFDELVEHLVRELYMNLSVAKDFAHKLNSAGSNNTELLLGRF